MGKLYLIAIASFMSFGVVAYSPVVSAATTSDECSSSTIENTGPGSVNVIDCKDTSTIKITCDNNATIDFNSDQVAESGDVTVKGNTVAGKGVSGDAVNQNAANIDVSAVCAALVAEETPPPAPTPAPAPAPNPAPKPAVAALPNTGETTLFEKVLGLSTAAIGGAFVLLGAAYAYKRFSA